jgi:hypothetical protein
MYFYVNIKIYLHNIHFHLHHINFHFLKTKGDPAEKATSVGATRATRATRTTRATIVGGSIKTTKMSLQKCRVPKKN